MGIEEVKESAGVRLRRLGSELNNNISGDEGIKAFQHQAALLPLLHGRDILLLVLQGLDLALEYDIAAPQHFEDVLLVVAYRSLVHFAASDRPLRPTRVLPSVDAENLQHFALPGLHGLLVFPAGEALHEVLQVVQQLIDHPVGVHLGLVPLHHLLHLRRYGLHVERYDCRVTGLCQDDVRFGDRADRAEDGFHFHVLVLKCHHRLFERFEGAVNICFQDQRELWLVLLLFAGFAFLFASFCRVLLLCIFQANLVWHVLRPLHELFSVRPLLLLGPR
mmetsp:Transcript_8894/g.25387  ORF Transcript_8894/g.25387 Transcript_8894/m.25387 type:complete len:277 (-) Transcript_8894:270-1100(-)